MKYEREILWTLVIILFGLVLFPRIVSGYTSETSTMTLMDLKEYASLPDNIKNVYHTTLDQNIKTLSSVRNAIEYQNKLAGIMNSAMSAPPLPSPGTSVSTTQGTPCQPGFYSSTGQTPCTPCPVNTYCPTLSMTTPIPCLGTTKSPQGSIMASQCS